MPALGFEPIVPLNCVFSRVPCSNLHPFINHLVSRVSDTYPNWLALTSGGRNSNHYSHCLGHWQADSEHLRLIEWMMNPLT